jgi:2-polyprenyl-3-methyl-5-hydroxy-6-metoxy-1,4-benzoquinol methylase
MAQGVARAMVLDVGCAEGFVSHRLLDRVSTAQVVGVDVDRQALVRGRTLHGTQARVEGDGARLPFASASFDLVLCTEVLEHVAEPERVLAEVCRVGYYCLLSVPWRPVFGLMNVLRGKNWARWGEDPDHRWSWGVEAFGALVAPYCTPLVSRLSPPWQVVLAACDH